MSLSCECDTDYDWFFQVSELEFLANSTGKCNGCGSSINVGEIVSHVESYELDEDGNECNWEQLGRLCETCKDMYDNLTELGFCIEHDGLGWINSAMIEYRLMLPESHKIKQGE